MPRDLLSVNSPQTNSQPTAKDLFNGNPNFGIGDVPRETQNPNENRGFLNNLGRQSAAIVGSAAQNIAKDFLPSAMSTLAPGGSGEIIAKTLPGFGKGRDVDFYKQFGVEKGIGSDIAQGALEFAPYYMGAGGAGSLFKSLPKVASLFEKAASAAPKSTKFAGEVAQNALAGGAMSANRDQDVGMGALLGAASVPVGYAITAPLKYGAKKLAQSAIPGLTQRATEKLKTLFDPNDYAARLKDIFVSKSKENTANWNAVDSVANKLDESLIEASKANPILRFDNQSYVNHIDNFLGRVKKLEPAKQAEYRQAIDFAERAKELAPQSFSGAVKLRQVINQELKDYLGQKGIASQNRQAKEFIKGLKDNLSGETISLNAKNLGENGGKEFLSAWNKANKSNIELQEFFKAKNPLGTIEEKRALKKALKSGELNDAAILDQFMPSPKQTGVAGLNQLTRLFGSKSGAQDAAKSYLNRRPLTNGNTVLDASTEYAKLSPAQRKWIYGDSKEGNLLETINKVRTEFGKEPERQFYKMFAHAAIPAALGGALGYHVGEGTGAASGVAVPLILSMLAGKAGGKLSPGAINRLTQYSKSPTKDRGRNVNALFQSLYQGGSQ